MIPVITTQLTTKIKVDWIQPNSGALDIMGYLVEILGGDGVTYFESVSCNGFDTLIIENSFC